MNNIEKQLKESGFSAMGLMYFLYMTAFVVLGYVPSWARVIISILFVVAWLGVALGFAIEYSNKKNLIDLVIAGAFAMVGILMAFTSISFIDDFIRNLLGQNYEALFIIKDVVATIGLAIWAIKLWKSNFIACALVVLSILGLWFGAPIIEWFMGKCGLGMDMTYGAVYFVYAILSAMKAVSAHLAE